MSRFPLLFLAGLPLLASLAAPHALAQTSSIIDRAEQSRPGAPAAPGAPSSATAPGVGTDEGTQRVVETRRLPLRLSAGFDTQLYATDNVFLSPGNTQDAVVWVSSLNLRVESLPVVVGEGQLIASAGFGYQRYVHDVGPDDPGIADLDFESYSLPLGLAYRWGAGYEATAGLTLGQLYSVRGQPAHEKLYASATFSAGLRKLTQLRRDLILSTGVGLAHSETWTSLSDVPVFLRYRDDRNDKLDATLDASLYVLRGPWVIVPYASVRQSNYYHYQEAAFATGREVERDDTTFSGGVTAVWNFAPWGSARVFASVDKRLSSEDGLPDDYTYGSASLGLGLALNVRY